MITSMLNSPNPAFFEFSENQLARIDPTHYPDLFDDTIYESDEFRMYGFKIKRCPRMRSHDWTQCPFAHRGEKARRRDPRKYNYAAIACPDFRNGECRRGDTCHYAHGVFEYWLHPAKYRTRACNAGGFCCRRVCFFAHTPEELRGEARYHYAYGMPPVGVDAIGTGLISGNGVVPPALLPPPPLPIPALPVTALAIPALPVATAVAAAESGAAGNPDFLASLSGLTIREGNEVGRLTIREWKEAGSSGSRCYAPESDTPDIEWIADLVE